MKRRLFLQALTSLLAMPIIGLKAEQGQPLATIRGHVIGKGLRFGKVTQKNPSGNYLTTFVVPGERITLSRLMKNEIGAYYSHKVGITHTDAQGYFEFTNLPGGYYTMRSNSAASSLQIVHVTQAAIYNVELKQLGR